MSSRRVMLLISALTCCVVAFLVFAPPKIREWRQSRQIDREIAWIQDSVQQLQKSPPPGADLIQAASAGQWEAPGYLIFSNDWVACRTHSAHRNDGMDDIAVLKMPNGNFYLSREHFCIGIAAATLCRPPRNAQTANATNLDELDLYDPHCQTATATNFLEIGARWQGWYLFSRDGKLQCIVRSPYEDHRKDAKGLWVWIGNVQGATNQTLFQKRYSIPALRDMFWKANWTSDDEIVVDVLDYGGNSPKMMGVDYLARLVDTLVFVRDKQTGMFMEKTNIFRVAAIP